MTILAIDGFDLYNGNGTNTGLQAKWALNVADTRTTMQTGRFTGQCVQFVGVNSSAGRFASRSLPSNYSSLSVNFAVRVTTFPAAQPPCHMVVENTATTQCGLQFKNDGSIVAGRFSGRGTAPTVLATSATGVILLNTWHYVQVDLVISDAGGSMVVKVDGVQVINVSTVDTKNDASIATANTVTIGIGNTAVNGDGTIQYDDFYVTDGATLGERKVERLPPVADTAQKDFTASTGTDNFAMVDDTTSNGDTDYVQASTVGNTDRYTFGALSSTPAAISAVQVTAFAEKTDATSRSIALQVKSGATTSDGSNFALAASYAKFDRILETDPNTSAAWTASAVNNLAAGPKVTV